MSKVQSQSQSDMNTLFDNQKVLQAQLEEQIALNHSQQQQLEQLQQAQQRRTLPTSELDLNLMLTDTQWINLPPQLREVLSEKKIVTDDKGNRFITKVDLSGLLGFYTRDLRLGNLSTLGGEVAYCEFMLNLAHDFLQEGHIEPFLISLSRVISKLEISQSRGGFLRKRHSTFTAENINKNSEPEKRNIMGSKRDKG